jgi:hypothetical protein
MNVSECERRVRFVGAGAIGRRGLGPSALGVEGSWEDPAPNEAKGHRQSNSGWPGHRGSGVRAAPPQEALGRAWRIPGACGSPMPRVASRPGRRCRGIRATPCGRVSGLRPWGSRGPGYRRRQRGPAPDVPRVLGAPLHACWTCYNGLPRSGPTRVVECRARSGGRIVSCATRADPASIFAATGRAVPRARAGTLRCSGWPGVGQRCPMRPGQRTPSPDEPSPALPQGDAVH